MDQFSTPTWDDILTDRLVARRRRERDQRTEVRNRVADLKAKSGCDRFPTDVRSLARSVGIRDVRFLPLPMRGRIVHESGGIVAELNEALSLREQRFVLAHEIAHLLLARDLNNAGARSVFGSVATQMSYRRVEQLCDYTAREILIPETAIRKELKKAGVSLQSIVAIAEQADCDVKVVAQCVCDLPGQANLIFLFCSVHRDTADVIEVVPPSSGRYELADHSDSLVRRALRAKAAVAGTQEVWMNGNRGTFDAQALCLDSGNVVLLTSG